MVFVLSVLLSNVRIIFFLNDTPPTDIYTYRHTLSLHDALPISGGGRHRTPQIRCVLFDATNAVADSARKRYAGATQGRRSQRFSRQAPLVAGRPTLAVPDLPREDQRTGHPEPAEQAGTHAAAVQRGRDCQYGDLVARWSPHRDRKSVV